MYTIDSEFTRLTRTLVEDLTSRLHSAFCREDALQDYYRLMDASSSAGRSSAYNHVKWDLVKKLTACGLDCDRDTPIPVLRSLIDQMMPRDQLKRQLYGELHDLYTQFPTASDHMARLVQRLADPDLLALGGSVRLTIVRQFLRHTKYNVLAVKKLVAAHCGHDAATLKPGEVIALADEYIFDVLDQPMTRDERRTYALVRLADDLAGGKFRMGGKTKSDLYHFAFAFGMTVYTGAPGTQPDKHRDLEQNLFRDFYNDNLLRYISRDYQANVTAYEQEPSGEGINYKNFAEVIYLYYLNRPDLTPAKRLSQANARIEECAKRARAGKVTTPRSYADPQYTQFYQDQFLQKVCALTPEELTDFICANYRFPEDLDSMASIAAESQRRSAARVYDELLGEVLELAEDESLSLEELDYGLDLSIEMEDYGESDPFTTLMEKLNDMLRIRHRDYPVSGTETEKKLTRTDLVALFACSYRLKGWGQGQSLPRLLKNFRTLIDPLLTEARFQPICEKNIFDVYTIVAMYLLENHSAPLSG